jgi:chromatin remodeling complex protein RSC6
LNLFFAVTAFSMNKYLSAHIWKDGESTATVSESVEELPVKKRKVESEPTKKKRVQTERKKKEVKGCRLSQDLSNVVGVDEATRFQVRKMKKKK